MKNILIILLLLIVASDYLIISEYQKFVKESIETKFNLEDKVIMCKRQLFVLKEICE